MEPAVLRDDMVDSLEHESKGVVRSDSIGLAMREVPREEFVEDEQGAYADAAQRSHGTRVLAPSTVARLIEALGPEDGDEVLVVGAGVGYTAAVLAEVVGARHVHAIDITRQLVFEARSNLAKAGYSEVLVDCRDGAEGLAEYAPFDRILVEAAAVEPPRALENQLAEDGQLVMPLGAGQQSLTIVHPDGEREPLGGVAFAPLLVDGEQAGAVERNRTAREERERADRQAQRRAGWEQDWIDWD